jgi:hypothetical protein
MGLYIRLVNAPCRIDWEYRAAQRPGSLLCVLPDRDHLDPEYAELGQLGH